MSYIFDLNSEIYLPSRAENPIVAELLCNYTYGRKWNLIYSENSNCISVGMCTEKELNNAEYVLNITDEGIYIKGCDYSATMRGFVTMLDKIKYSEKEDCFYLENCCEYGKPMIDFRCVHLCIFPETSIDFLKKCVRSCAIAKYSHIILEFWGMLKFDCMKELSWPFAYSKEDIKVVVKEANALGVEIIPMFNHLGHASACREVNGKHVVLDQNPKYEYLFDSYGWIWNSKRADVCELLAKIRDELIEVCGEGKYFHIGCDEAYAIGNNKNAALDMANYINGVARELEKKGRRCIIWHDMLVSKADFEGYVANSTPDISEILLNTLDKNIIIADWQYWRYDESWKTSKKFKDCGFDTVCCPWDNKDNVDSAISTVKENSLFGIIHTTWQSLFRGFREMVYAGVVSYDAENKNLKDIHRFYCAHLARKTMPSNGEYEECGWSEKMVGPGLV